MNQKQQKQQNQNSFLKKISDLVKKMITVDDYVFDELFNIGRVKHAKKAPKNKQTGQAQPAAGSKDEPSYFRLPKKPYTVAELKAQKNKNSHGHKIDPEQTLISKSLELNLNNLKEVFHLPKNKDVVIREFSVPLDGLTKAAIVYIDGAADTRIIDSFVLQPLMLLANIAKTTNGNPMETVKNILVPTNQLKNIKNIQGIIEGVVNGDTAILLNNSETALIVETKGWPGRGVGDPKTEKVTQGPSDSFNESFRQNLALIRKRVRSNSLVTEYFKIGWRSNTDLALVYLEGVINPKLVREMRKRLKLMKVAYVTDTGIIQQFISDSPYSIIPTSLATERPDRVAAFLNEGHLAIVMDGSPFAIVAPITIWGLLHSPEDYYLNPVVGTFTRIIRTISFFIGVMTPAFYIAITNYHPEMIPTELLLAIASSRENVPFPVIVEVLLMEVSFELIREAGVRIPSVLGSTIGIVGALILGQAAVQANIVSPILVIVVAVTALSSFTIPNIALSYAVRIMRFIFILLAAIVGFFGIAFALLILSFLVTGLKSLGVPMLSPIAPFKPKSGDIVIRKPFFTFDTMPTYMAPKAKYLQAKLVRKWDPKSRNKMKGDS
ncbi:MAG: spore germination protein [Thermincola sp.]|jgi:spore germination protein KA|nr:spore germination protein [Thermincola sp.]